MEWGACGTGLAGMGAVVLSCGQLLMVRGVGRYRGPLCSVCEPGYGKLDGTQCSACPDMVWSILIGVAGFVVILGAISFLVRQTIKDAGEVSLRSSVMKVRRTHTHPGCGFCTGADSLGLRACRLYSATCS